MFETIADGPPATGPNFQVCCYPLVNQKFILYTHHQPPVSIEPKAGHRVIERVPVQKLLSSLGMLLAIGEWLLRSSRRVIVGRIAVNIPSVVLAAVAQVVGVRVAVWRSLPHVTTMVRRTTTPSLGLPAVAVVATCIAMCVVVAGDRTIW